MAALVLAVVVAQMLLVLRAVLMVAVVVAVVLVAQMAQFVSFGPVTRVHSHQLALAHLNF
jgi:hypothetical protein